MELRGAEHMGETRPRAGSVSSKNIGREQFLRKLSTSGSAGNIQTAMCLLTEYVGASHYLLARYDLIQEHGLDFIVASNWPFDLVRRIGAELVRGYGRSTEIEKCLSLLTPQFALLPDDATLPPHISRQYCSLMFCVGRTRFSVMLLFDDGLILSQDRLREVGVLAAYVLSLGDRREMRAERDFELTDRELECLFWIAEGKTSDEIAVFLGISRNTINNYITKYFNKYIIRNNNKSSI